MKEGDPMPTNNKPNRLIAEKSPYLLQHAHTPVKWYPGEKNPSKKQTRKQSGSCQHRLFDMSLLPLPLEYPKTKEIKYIASCS